MSEEEIIKNIEDMLLHAETNLLDYEALALQGLLDLYNKEKEKNKELELKLDKINQTNTELKLVGQEPYVQAFLSSNYISKDEIKALLQDVDNTKFINKHVKGMYLYDNLKCLLEE